MSAWAAAAVLAFTGPRALGADAAPTPPAAAPAEPAVVADGDKPSEHRWDWAVFPVVFYAPETSLGVAAGAAIFDNAPSPAGQPRRDDSVTLGVQATLRRQVSLNLNVTKYFDDARWQLTEDAALAHVPNFYWGLGNNTPDAASEPFTQSGVYSRVTLATRLIESLYVGAGFTAAWYGVSGENAGGLVDDFSRTTPASGSLFGVGPILRRDTRDDALGAHAGSISSFAATFFPGGVGAYKFQYYELDHRSHFALGSWSVLAIELYGLYAPGHVPLVDMPALGGGSRLRGYYQGRYRDHLYVMGQAEWRAHVWGRLSLAPFAGVGNVFPTLAALTVQDPKVAGGLSVRVCLKKDRDLNVHADLAWAPGSASPALYLNLGEAF